MIKKIINRIKKGFFLFTLTIFYFLFKLINKIKLFNLFVLPILFFILFRDIYMSNKYEDKHEETIQFATNEIGHVSYVTGPVGAGKTTGMNGISHCLQIGEQRKIEKDKRWCKRILWKLNYTKLNQLIAELRNLNFRYETIAELYIESDDFSEYKGKIHDDGVNRIKLNELIFSYIRAEYRRLDNNFVMANIECYSRITNNINKNLERDYLKLKKKMCYIEHYNVVMFDETTLDENNLDTTDVNAEDGGQEITYKLVRHLWEGSCFLLFSAQVMTRDVKKLRELATSEIAVYHRRLIEMSTAKSLFYRFKLKMIELDKWFFKKLFCKDLEELENQPNYYKEAEAIYNDKLDLIYSKAYLEYSAVVKKKDVSRELIDKRMVFPINHCYGVSDTHYWKRLLKWLKLVQKMSYYDVNEIQEMPIEEQIKIFEKILKMKEEARKERRDKSKKNKEEHAKNRSEDLEKRKLSKKERKNAKITAAKEAAEEMLNDSEEEKEE